MVVKRVQMCMDCWHEPATDTPQKPSTVNKSKLVIANEDKGFVVFCLGIIKVTRGGKFCADCYSAFFGATPLSQTFETLTDQFTSFIFLAAVSLHGNFDNFECKKEPS